MSEETNERYAIVIHPDVVVIMDTQYELAVEDFTGGDRLLAATGRLAELNGVEKAGEDSPATFLAETLPAYAKRQYTDLRRRRAEAHLAEVIDIEGTALEQVRTYSEILRRATALRLKLEDTLRPLSEPVSAQKPEGVPASTPATVEALTDAQSPDVWSFVERQQAERRSAPGPY